MFIVVMCGGEPYTPDYRNFCCHGNVWKQILELAKEWGWKPMGTTSDRHWGKEIWEKIGFPADYLCDDIGKIFTDADGKALAEALERAVANPVQYPAIDGPILMVEGMNAEEYRMANAPLSCDLLKSFVRFVKKGAFYFFWDD